MDPRVIGGMATMPSRAHTFVTAFHSVISQVERLYLYLDGFTEVPEVARGDPRVIPILPRDVPGVRSAGKLLGVMFEQYPCRYVSVDDDFIYPPDHVERLERALAEYGDRAAVGIHGVLLANPFERTTKGGRILPGIWELKETTLVDVLGTGLAMFNTGTLRFDVRDWPFVNMTDLGFAIEAARKDVPLICIAHEANAVIPLEYDQPDSVYLAAKKDDSGQTALACRLLELRPHAAGRPLPLR